MKDFDLIERVIAVCSDYMATDGLDREACTQLVVPLQAALQDFIHCESSYEAQTTRDPWPNTPFPSEPACQGETQGDDDPPADDDSDYLSDAEAEELDNILAFRQPYQKGSFTNNSGESTPHTLLIPSGKTVHFWIE